MLEKLYPYRFGLFFFSQIMVLFGSLLLPLKLEGVILSVFFLLNILAGIVLVSKDKYSLWFYLAILAILALIFMFNLEDRNGSFSYMKMVLYFLFYGITTYHLIKQVLSSAIINKNVIFGLISGYISIGLIGFFICLAIEVSNPGSFEGLNLISGNSDSLTEALMYFSYITLLTIGYGDILPVTVLAQKAVILIGLMGQMYLVVLTAIVIGKYINQLSKHKNEDNT